MPNVRLTHDCAMACAAAITDMVSPCLREEERREFLGMAYEAVKAAIQKYEEMASREARRLSPLRPSDN